MPKEILARQYRMPDADLKQLADALVASINRDITYFTTRRITPAQVQEIKEQIQNFDATTTDEEYLGLHMEATEQKDAVAGNLRKALRTIRNMAEVAYNGKGKYFVFGFEGMVHMNDYHLYRLARRVVRVGARLQDDLRLQGLMDNQLPAIAALATQLDEAIEHIGDISEQRQFETLDRVTKGNALWAEMNRLASIGRSLFEDTNPALHNDYVLVGG
ncbi:hypothetical protein [Foetidibacter luteolus]|uniref:hypothetical protein n=1 Tax=Foetidibacter luteolus TaxID=2608880 RepID=UPI00129BCBB4|nr:hypothetical protein [Foetidibacter luteolus]